MKYVVLMAAVAAGAIAVPAQAEDFSGFRIEARGGWEQVKAKASYPNPADDEEETGDEFLVASGHDGALSYGGEFGYDMKLGSSLVVGAYAGADFSDARNCAELVGDDLACADLGRTFTIGARAGIPMGESVLVYAKGGYSNGRMSAAYDDDVTDNDDTTPGEIAYYRDNFDGYHVGGGLEFALAQGLYAKAEYVYTDYGKNSYLLDGADPGDPELTLGSHRHQVAVGVGLRF